MNWKYDSVVQEHQLVDGKNVLARVQSSPRKRGGFTVTTLIYGIYFGLKKQLLLEKQKKEWVASRKKFKDKETANEYIARRKQGVQKFISAREKEG